MDTKTPFVSDEQKPLSYYLKNGLWYFTQPPDQVTGQVIPKTTVESWLGMAERQEAELQALRDRVEKMEKMEKTGGAVLAYLDKSTDPPKPIPAVYHTPAYAMRLAAEAIERRDAAISDFRDALANKP